MSRLLDLCRQSIIFDTPDCVLACLRAISQDSEVQVVRISNKMDPDYDGRASAGYRDVALNLQITTEESQRLGVDSHICELQLILRKFAELKV